MQPHLRADRVAGLLGDAVHGSPAYAAIADSLRLLISDGRIPAGTRLPSERELTDALAVSRTTVSRAYAVLKERGFLVAQQGSGSLASLPGGGHTTDPLLGFGVDDPDQVNLTCAAPAAPAGLASAYEFALRRLPEHLQTFGYYPTGLPELREAIAARYTARGLPTSADQILVTPGALAGLSIALRAFVGRADRVLTESPTYPNAIAAIRGTGARILAADVDPAGGHAGVVDAIDAARPTAAYLMPDFHNPTGLLLDDPERVRLAASLRRQRTLTLVDETMAMLALDEGAAPLPFAAHRKDALLIGSASKEFWGGLRLGWIRAPHARMPALVAARLSMDLGSPVVEQLALVHLLAQGPGLLELRLTGLAESRAALAAAVASRLPSWSFTLPRGGLSLWCRLPRPASTALTAAAERYGVQLAAGPLFAPAGGLEHHLRLPYTQSPEVLAGAVDRLAEAWTELAGTSRRTPKASPSLVT